MHLWENFEKINFGLMCDCVYSWWKRWKVLCFSETIKDVVFWYRKVLWITRKTNVILTSILHNVGRRKRKNSLWFFSKYRLPATQRATIFTQYRPWISLHQSVDNPRVFFVNDLTLTCYKKDFNKRMNLKVIELSLKLVNNSMCHLYL